MKNYVGFVNDHSGSMSSLKYAAIKDYNANITATKDAASREMLDTVVSVVGIGIGEGKGRHRGDGYGTKRQVVVSNPHVLKPVTNWSTSGGTPLWDGVGDMIDLLESLPDSQAADVSFLVITTTDGQEQHSVVETQITLAQKIARLQRTGRWTFVFRVPKGGRSYLAGLGVHHDNIQEWDTTTAGMEASTVQTTQAMNNYYTARSAGAKSSTVFYANAAAVDTKALVKINDKVSLYVVDGLGVTEGMQIRDFILQRRSQYLKGAAFYQLTKTEARVTETKLVAVRDRTTGDIFSGQQARTMIGLPQYGNGRIHPGDHKNYDIFIQSESVNRKLVKGTGVLYWEEKGVPFTKEELDKFLAPAQMGVPLKPAVVQLPAVAPTNRPTPSPIPVVKQVQGPTLNGRPVRIFAKRDEARALKVGTVLDLRKFPTAPKTGISPADRWAVYI